MLRTSTSILLMCLLSGCATRVSRPPDLTAEQIHDRTGQAVRPLDVRPTGDLPAGVALEDGVTEDDAVATALWNNAQLAADLATLGIARANLVEAGLLRNPSLQILLPVGAKPFELALTWPIDALIQRPRRIKAAQRAWEQVAEGLVQHGLNTARDARQAHAALIQAQEHALLGAEAAKLQAEIALMTKARLRAGDVGQPEVGSAEADASLAADTAGRAQHDAAIARDRLRILMGLPPTEAARLRPVTSALPLSGVPPADSLREAAWTQRPDLRAQELAVAAAAQRAGWERSRWLVLAAILSTKEIGSNGVLSGPGVSADLPLFGTTRGGVARANAEVEQAARQYVALRQRVDLEVSEAREVLARATESLAEHANHVLPPVEAAADAARKAYEAGDVAHLLVVGINRQVVEARLRLVDLEADARRARAELDRCVGTRIETLKLP